jgi:hypothetical protein
MLSEMKMRPLLASWAVSGAGGFAGGCVWGGDGGPNEPGCRGHVGWALAHLVGDAREQADNRSRRWGKPHRYGTRRLACGRFEVRR